MEPGTDCIVSADIAGVFFKGHFGFNDTLIGLSSSLRQEEEFSNCLSSLALAKILRPKFVQKKTKQSRDLRTGYGQVKLNIDMQQPASICIQN